MNKFKESLGKFLGSAKEKWGGFTKGAKVGIIAIFSAVIVSLVVVTLISNNKSDIILYTATSSEELASITNVLANELGVSEYRISGNSILISPENEANVRWELAMRGYPKTPFGFDHYNNRINMFSTETEMKEYYRQQISYQIKAALEIIPQVKMAIPNISLGSEDPYVIATNEKLATASVVLELMPGQSLKSEQIDGIYNIVLTSYEGFTRDRIHITDGNGILLTAEDATLGEKDLSYRKQEFDMLLNVKNQFEESLEKDLEALLSGFSTNSSVNVSAIMDFGSSKSESVVYSPSVDEDGTRGGMVANESDNTAWGGMTEEGGVVGTAPNADISPDYPTLIADADTDIFYERIREIEYKIDQEITQYESAPFTIKDLSCAIVLDDTNLTPDEIDEYRQLFANALGTTFDNVSVMARPFGLEGGSGLGNDPISPISGSRNTLIFIIMALGALLIILFFLAILTASSKKKRLVRSKLAGTAGYAPGAGAYAGPDFDQQSLGIGATQNITAAEEPESFKLQSLLGNPDGETRESALKTEIREFTKTNPDIVAQLIRTWMKEIT